MVLLQEAMEYIDVIVMTNNHNFDDDFGNNDFTNDFDDLECDNLDNNYNSNSDEFPTGIIEDDTTSEYSVDSVLSCEQRFSTLKNFIRTHKLIHAELINIQ